MWSKYIAMLFPSSIPAVTAYTFTGKSLSLIQHSFAMIKNALFNK